MKIPVVRSFIRRQFILRSGCVQRNQPQRFDMPNRLVCADVLHWSGRQYVYSVVEHRCGDALIFADERMMLALAGASQNLAGLVLVKIGGAAAPPLPR